MPEGDTIFRSAVTLRRWLGGRELTEVRSRVPGLSGDAMVGSTIDSIEARGKHLLMSLSNGLVLHTHMRMTGSWHLYPAGERWSRPASQARLVLQAGERVAVCFNAPVVELLGEASARSHPSLSRLGPDVLGAGPIEPGEVVKRAEARSIASPTVGELLLDQQVVCGIGNIYRCESLFLAGLNPFLPSGTISRDQLMDTIAIAARLMKANAVGSMADRSFGAGPDQRWVYRRSGLQCRRCGSVILRKLLGEQARAAYWCPTCQPMRTEA